MVNRSVAIILVFLYTVKLSPDERRLFVLWNVGQGQWATIANLQECIHIDSGGEHDPLKKVLHFCHSKQNRHFLSHYDWDHFNFISSLRRHVRDLCRIGAGPHVSHKKRARQYTALPTCLSSHTYIEELWRPSSDQKFKQANDYSRVALVRNKVLIPGDSTTRAEKFWTSHAPETVRVLILGHHGSQTSTGPALLGRLSNLHMVWVSARKRRYGHPHAKVLKRLKRLGLHPLTTEAWGALGFEL